MSPYFAQRQVVKNQILIHCPSKFIVFSQLLTYYLVMSASGPEDQKNILIIRNQSGIFAQNLQKLLEAVGFKVLSCDLEIQSQVSGNNWLPIKEKNLQSVEGDQSLKISPSLFKLRPKEIGRVLTSHVALKSRKPRLPQTSHSLPRFLRRAQIAVCRRILKSNEQSLFAWRYFSTKGNKPDFILCLDEPSYKVGQRIASDIPCMYQTTASAKDALDFDANFVRTFIEQLSAHLHIPVPARDKIEMIIELLSYSQIDEWLFNYDTGFQDFFGFYNSIAKTHKVSIFAGSGLNVCHILENPLFQKSLKWIEQVEIVYPYGEPDKRTLDALKNIPIPVRFLKLSDLYLEPNSKGFTSTSNLAHNVTSEIICHLEENAEEGDFLFSKLKSQYDSLSKAIECHLYEIIFSALLRQERAQEYFNAKSNWTKVGIFVNLDDMGAYPQSDNSHFFCYPQGHFPNRFSSDLDSWAEYFLKHARIHQSRDSQNLGVTFNSFYTNFVKNKYILEVIESLKAIPTGFDSPVLPESTMIALHPGDTQYRETALEYIDRQLFTKNITLWISGSRTEHKKLNPDFIEEIENLIADRGKNLSVSFLKNEPPPLIPDLIQVDFDFEKAKVFLDHLVGNRYSTYILAKQVETFFKRDIFRVVGNFLFFHESFKENPPKLLLSIPGRPNISRLISYAAHANHIPDFSIEPSLFGEEPNLKPFSNTLVGVIDNYEQGILRRFYKIPEDQILLTGSLHLHRRLNQIVDLKTRCQKSPHKKILICTQSDSLESNIQLVSWCCHAVKDLPDIEVVVKVHPSESPRRWNEYEKVLKSFEFNASVNNDNLYTQILESHLVCTRYSTVCYEAFFADVPTLCVQLETDEAILDFEAIGIALTTKTPEKTTEILNGLLDQNSKSYLQLRNLRNQYRKLNPQLFDVDPMQRVFTRVEKLLSMPIKTQDSKELEI